LWSPISVFVPFRKSVSRFSLSLLRFAVLFSVLFPSPLPLKGVWFFASRRRVRMTPVAAFIPVSGYLAVSMMFCLGGSSSSVTPERACWFFFCFSSHPHKNLHECRVIVLPPRGRCLLLRVRLNSDGFRCLFFPRASRWFRPGFVRLETPFFSDCFLATHLLADRCRLA